MYNASFGLHPRVPLRRTNVFNAPKPLVARRKVKMVHTRATVVAPPTPLPNKKRNDHRWLPVQPLLLRQRQRCPLQKPHHLVHQIRLPVPRRNGNVPVRVAQRLVVLQLRTRQVVPPLRPKHRSLVPLKQRQPKVPRLPQLPLVPPQEPNSTHLSLPKSPTEYGTPFVPNAVNKPPPNQNADPLRLQIRKARQQRLPIQPQNFRFDGLQP